MSDADDEGHEPRKPDLHEGGASISLDVADVVRISLFVAGSTTPDETVVPERLDGLRVEVPAETVNAVKAYVFERPELRNSEFGRRILYANRDRTLSTTTRSCGFGPGN